MFTLFHGQRQRIATIRALKTFSPTVARRTLQPFGRRKSKVCLLIDSRRSANNAGLISPLSRFISCPYFDHLVIVNHLLTNHPSNCLQVTSPCKELIIASLGCPTGTTLLLLALQLYQMFKVIQRKRRTQKLFYN